MQKTITNQFCLDILKLGVPHNKALANTVMAPASYKADNVVTLSESPARHYQYSSLNDAISHLAWDDASLLEIEGEIRRLCMNRVWEPIHEPPVLQTDKTTKRKPHSITLKDRFPVHIPNCKAPGTRGLDIGLEDSFVNLCAEDGLWSLPLSGRNIPLDRTASQTAAEQIRDLFADKELPFHSTPLVINVLDAGYSVEYIDGVKGIDNLVSILRLRQSSKVYAPAAASDSTAGKTPKVYGRRYYLIPQSGWKHYDKHPKTKEPYKIWRDAITDLPPDDQTDYCQILAGGRRVEVRLRRWDELLMRTKNGISMQDKPFSLLLVEVFDVETQKPVFKNPLYLAVFGQKRARLYPEQIHNAYRKRFGIEGLFRFVKRNMFLEKYQTSSNQYLKNWVYIIILAVWLLFSARKAVSNRPKKWQKYKVAEKKSPGQALSMSQTYKSIQPYLLTFDQEPFLPQKSKPGPGRRPGKGPGTKRHTYSYTKKNVKKTKKAKKNSKNQARPP